MCRWYLGILDELRPQLLKGQLPPLGQGHGWLPSNYICVRSEAGQEDFEGLRPLPQDDHPHSFPADGLEFSFTHRTACRISEDPSPVGEVNQRGTEGGIGGEGEDQGKRREDCRNGCNGMDQDEGQGTTSTFRISSQVPSGSLQYFQRLYNVYTLAGESPAPAMAEEYWQSLPHSASSPFPAVEEVSEAEISRLYTSVCREPDDSIGELKMEGEAEAPPPPSVSH